MPAFRPCWTPLVALAASSPLTLQAQLSAEARLARQADLVAADRATADTAVRLGFAEAFRLAAAPDLVLVYPGAPVVAGLDAVREMLAGQSALQTLTIRWAPLHAEVSADGDFGVSYGVTGIVVSDSAPTPPLRFGKYLSAWRNTAAGWRLVAHVQVGLLPGAAYVEPHGVEAAPLPPLAATGAVAAFAHADLAFAALAGRSGAPAAFAAYAAADAVTFAGTGELVRGPAAIRRWLTDEARSSWDWRPVAAGGSARGDLGYTVGESVITPPGEDSFYGKYLTLWRREPNGRIRFLADGGNARPKPAGP
jgi:ketosteroid isomerase-like protein